MGRLAWYAGVSTALAGGVIISAFNQRANFYSACVYLSQSNLCLMILINLILFIYATLMYGLQRLCYGALRPIEIEQLYEKGWFAVTETCLAMTIFREEVGAWFLVMFVGLLTGKVWGWIGDGRVEILEQQPPANPRLFHMRLSISLTMSVIYDLWLMNYCINTVIQQARPNMMVMFLFEFAILTTSSLATACRYGISLMEAKVVKKQTHERLLERRREVREERAELIRQREAAAAAATEDSPAPEASAPLPSEDDVDEMDIEVPGWEAKGQWVLTLDLITDFLKLGIYVAFFFILLMFYGIPIHIIRDLFITARSFTKRLAAFLRYRRATRDMNERYPDATAEDIQREDTCIICREEMRPWAVTNPQAPPAAPGALPPARPGASINERTRPKKLPCGHILHLGCLKSWLERQQVCPTCRAPVVNPPGGQPPRAPANNAPGQAQQPQIPGQQDGAGGQAPVAGRPAGRGMRMLNLGPLRLGFGQGNANEIAQELGVQPGNDGPGPRVYGLELGFPGRRAQPQAQVPATSNPSGAPSLQGRLQIQGQLQQIEQQIAAEIQNLQIAQQELQLVQLLQAELARLRLVQNGGADPLAPNFQMPPMPQLGPFGGERFSSAIVRNVPQMQRHGVRPGTTAIPAGSPDLPPGVSIPEGWSLLPLQRLDGPAATVAQATLGLPVPITDAVSSTATTQIGISPTVGSINTLTPTPTRVSQTSSVDSSDTNAIHTPSSVAADQSHTQGINTTLPSSSSAISTNATSSSATPGLSLPNWGSSQLFSAPTRTLNADNTSAGPSTSTEEPTTSSSGDQDAEQKADKGKGKAVTIEDADDPDV